MGIYYTHQHEDAWKAALERRYLQGDPQYAFSNDEGFEFFKPAYDWMVEQYEQRIGISLCGNYPVWCWDEFPDLSRGGHIGQGNKGVVLTVELPDDQVLASEISFWESLFCITLLFAIQPRPLITGRILIRPIPESHGKKSLIKNGVRRWRFIGLSRHQTINT